MSGNTLHAEYEEAIQASAEATALRDKEKAVDLKEKLRKKIVNALACQGTCVSAF